MPKNEIYYEIARNKQRNNTECWLPIAGVFSCPSGAGKNITQLAKCPHVLYVKQSNEVSLLF